MPFPFHERRITGSLSGVDVGGAERAHEAIFREMNERLEQKARNLIDPRDVARVPFLCECPKLDCTEVAMLSLSEYETVRENGQRGLAVPGHEDLTVERVVAATSAF